MECFGTTDFDNNSRLITLSAIIIRGLHCIKTNLQEVEYGDMDWIEVAQDTDRWRVRVNAVTNLRVP
jgi:hypothetical protein